MLCLPGMPTRSPDLIQHLFAKMNELIPSYPDEVVRIPARIEGTAFFPGGDGLYREGGAPAISDLPLGGVMILGHNFDSERGFRASVDRGSESLTTGTWRNLLRLLEKTAIPVDRCFFTNAFMGLCKGDDNKKFLGRGNSDFRAACLEFLRVQIAVQRPKLIIALGVKVPPMLAGLSDDLAPWAGRFIRKRSDPEFHLKDLDAAPVFGEVRFALDCGIHTATLTAIAHPSDARNGRLRKPAGFAPGPEVEVEIVRRAYELSLED